MENTKSTSNKVLEEIREERKHQDKKWGGPNHDDAHGPYAWTAFIMTYLGLALSDFVNDTSRAGATPNENRVDAQLRKFRYNMVKIAALAVAAIESVDRKLGDG